MDTDRIQLAYLRGHKPFTAYVFLKKDNLEAFDKVLLYAICHPEVEQIR